MCYYVELLEAAVMFGHLRGVAKAGCCSRWGTSARSFEPLQHSFLHAFFHNLIYHAHNLRAVLAKVRRLCATDFIQREELSLLVGL
jgi:hypothetical protein